MSALAAMGTAPRHAVGRGSILPEWNLNEAPWVWDLTEDARTAHTVRTFDFAERHNMHKYAEMHTREKGRIRISIQKCVGSDCN
jgi:hypothetical protein